MKMKRNDKMVKFTKCLATKLSVSYALKKFNCRCNNCLSYKKYWTWKDRFNARKRVRKWLKTHKRKATKKQRRISHIKDKGLTIAEYNNLVKTQKSRCAICLNKFQWKRNYYHLSIDHCHKTGKIRGLLCGRCNLGLGQFRDSIKLQIGRAHV